MYTNGIQFTVQDEHTQLINLTEQVLQQNANQLQAIELLGNENHQLKINCQDLIHQIELLRNQIDETTILQKRKIVYLREKIEKMSDKIRRQRALIRHLQESASTDSKRRRTQLHISTEAIPTGSFILPPSQSASSLLNPVDPPPTEPFL